MEMQNIQAFLVRVDIEVGSKYIQELLVSVLVPSCS